MLSKREDQLAYVEETPAPTGTITFAQTQQQDSNVAEDESVTGPNWRPFPSRQQRRASTVTPASATPTVMTLSRDAKGLAALAYVLGEDTPLTLRPSSRSPEAAYLSAQGAVVTNQGHFTDPTAALIAAGIAGEDGWLTWHLGDEDGPTLAEAIQELNDA